MVEGFSNEKLEYYLNNLKLENPQGSTALNRYQQQKKEWKDTMEIIDQKINEKRLAKSKLTDSQFRNSMSSLSVKPTHHLMSKNRAMFNNIKNIEIEGMHKVMYKKSKRTEQWERNLRSYHEIR